MDSSGVLQSERTHELLLVRISWGSRSHLKKASYLRRKSLSMETLNGHQFLLMVVLMVVYGRQRWQY